MIAEEYRQERSPTNLISLYPVVGKLSYSGPPRASYPEAQGLRHLAFVVDDVRAAKAELEQRGVNVQRSAT